ncbi:ABC transporter ATP-binding protein [Allopusillimonas ginsengisoli]|uniref:ABC transporter ATP-binding protein n=1 Tax=Allopusillimonas ginsengisoli TaxID=453575 RepID=UPI00101EE1E4|nr:ABC transporter ATP-binding protein [Allopusillimonas ginsengisoli]TEA78824.1 ABC transporter ATP-binding protein [Allopusillimonas ginsengisoli]
MNEALLEVRDLCVALPSGADRPFAVKNVSFSLAPGEILCIVGESGSGKSVSANAIMGLLPDAMKPKAGSILFKGSELLKQTEEQRLSWRGKDIGMIFQEPMSALNPIMQVGEQIAEVMAVHGTHSDKARHARVLELLAFVGLPDPERLRHSYPFRLSGGQRQRVMIAMALALEPAIVIADEPTTALDVTTQAQILALIKSIQRAMGMGVIFITHDFGVVAEIADRVAVMEKGILVEQGQAQQVLNQPQHPYTRRLIAAVPHLRAEERRSDQDVPLLQVKNLQKTYTLASGLFVKKRTLQAVNNVSFDVHRGETFGIVGESGSGKSTLGKCLVRLTAVEGGSLLFNGEDIAQLHENQFRPYRKKIQMIFQDPFASLNPRHKTGRIIMDGPLANGVSAAKAEKKARELLELVGLQSAAFDRYPNEFSGGQRQRIGIARALAMEPELLVADESVSALDVSVQAQVLALLADLQRQFNLAIVFITHDLRVAAQICHRLAVMHQGAIVEQGAPAQIFDAPQHPYTQQLIDAVPGKAWDSSAVVLS